MPLPEKLRNVTQELIVVENDLTATQTAIDALPATPLEADLPDIVAIVASLKSITDGLLTQVQEFISLVSKTRVN